MRGQYDGDSVIVPLIALAAWRLMTQKQWNRARQKTTANDWSAARLGLDSEFYLVEHQLKERGLDRREGETLTAWLTRIGHEGALHLTELSGLLTLHYRLRFDPAGLSGEQRELLRSRSKQWVARNENSSVKR